MLNSSVSLLTALVTGVIVFLLGVAWAAVRGSNRAYKTIKDSVKPARKTFWGSVWTLVKIGVGAAVLLLVLVVWQLNDIQGGGADPARVPADVSPSARPT
jgi:xanthine/uracil permease